MTTKDGGRALLRAAERRKTEEWLAAHQQTSGEILWSKDGKSDPWDHVHAAMGLAALGRIAPAKTAYRWLASVQEPSGGFAAERVGGHVTRVTQETNHAAYVATGDGCPTSCQPLAGDGNHGERTGVAGTR